MGDARTFHLRGMSRLLSDPYDPRSLSARARERRWAELLGRFPDFGSMSVLDLGGTAAFWRSAPAAPGSLTLLNLLPQDPPVTGAQVLTGDACEPPAILRGSRFDLVVSNSVIGHVGGHERRKRFADTVLERGTHHWIQTPSRSFPVDPVFLFPFFAWLPLPAKVQVSRRWPLGSRRASSAAEALALVLEMEWVSARQLAHYFPGSEIWRERALGITKSLVAVA